MFCRCLKTLTLVSLFASTACRSPSESDKTPEALPNPPSTTITDTNLPLWVDAYSEAAADANALRSSQPDDAKRLQYIADQPQALWLGEWSHFQVDASMQGKLLPLVIYYIPDRDCGSYSAGGGAAAAYLGWIENLVKALGAQPAWIILEPDALAQVDCLPAEKQKERLQLLKDAVRLLKKAPGARVYLDAGHAAWKTPEVMVERLMQAGLAEADGFALNVSNYQTIDVNVKYGQAIRALLTSRKNFVIDTSRNGLGPDPEKAWCNPRGRALGHAPTLQTGIEGVDAFLWIKRPGQSDGTCNGGPTAGAWWREIALEMAKGAGL